MAGLPRSGSTLLSSILNQNPAIYAGSNSPMCGMVFNLERSIIASEQYQAFPKPHVLPATICGVLENYYSDRNEEIVIDKSREWAIQEHFQVLLRNLDSDPKILMPVRTINDILASFINLVNSNPNSASFIDKEIQERQEFNFYREINDIRCDHLMRPKGLIDNCLYGIAFALLPENRKYFHFIEYENLTRNTEEELEKIYDFLGLDNFKHNLYNIENVTPENDTVYGLKGMHDVRKTINNRNINAQQILSPYIYNKYRGQEFWRQ